MRCVKGDRCRPPGLACITQVLAAKADYKLQWGTLHEKKYLPLKKRHAALEQCGFDPGTPFMRMLAMLILGADQCMLSRLHNPAFMKTMRNQGDHIGFASAVPFLVLVCEMMAACTQGACGAGTAARRGEAAGGCDENGGGEGAA